MNEDTPQALRRDLTKWPRLLVTGQPVTREQANEILVRTDGWCLTTNDYTFRQQVYDLAGIPTDEHGWPRWPALAEFHASVGALDLHYLGNARIVSSWIGGPHGWCDWSGGIGCADFNIGKWPSHEEVEQDWRTIAAAFPYLDLTAQLVADEGADTLPAVEYMVVGGRVTVDYEPQRFITSPQELSVGATLSILVGAHRERGVDLERLAEAVAQCRATAAGG